MTTHDLAERLTRLERENRRLKRIGAVALIGIVAVVVMGQAEKEEPPVHEKLCTKALHIVDDNGKTRMALGVGKAGAPAIGLLDKGKKPRVVIALNKNEMPTLGLMDEAGTPRLALGLDESGSSALGLKDEKGVLRVALSVGNKVVNVGAPDPKDRVVLDTAGLVIKDGAGVSRAVLGCTVSGGSSFLNLHDRKGVLRSTNYVLELGDALVGVCGHDQKVRLGLTLGEGLTSLMLNDGKGTRRFSLVGGEFGPTRMKLFDDDGEVVFMAPK